MLGEEAGAASNDSIISGDTAGGVQRARATQPANVNQRKGPNGKSRKRREKRKENKETIVPSI